MAAQAVQVVVSAETERQDTDLGDTDRIDLSQVAGTKNYWVKRRSMQDTRAEVRRKAKK